MTAVLALAGCGQEAASERDARPPADARGDAYAALAERIQAEMQELEVPGVAFAIIEHGEVSWREGFGVLHAGSVEPMTPDVIFPLGFTSTSLTAFGLLRLVGTGDIDLDQPVTSYVEDFALTRNPDRVARLTVRHLLTDASGLPDEKPHAANDAPDITSSEFADFYSLMFEPGEMAYHSSWAANVVGLVGERVGGQPLAEYMRAQVFEPLGMTRSTFQVDEVQTLGDVALGTDDGVTTVSSLHSCPSWVAPCCLGYASVADMARFARFLAAGDATLLPDELHQLMISGQVDVGVIPERIHHGMGVLVARGHASMTESWLRSYPFSTVFYSGAFRFNTTAFVVVPEHGFAVVYSANRYPAYFEQTLTTAFELFLGASIAQLEEVSADPANLSIYEGTYRADTGTQSASDDTVTVERVDDQLHITYPPDQQLCVAELVSPGNVRCQNASSWLGFPGTTLTFFLNDDGNVEYLRAMPLGFVAVPEPRAPRLR